MRNDTVYPPNDTPAYDLLAKIGMAVVTGDTDKVPALVREYRNDFLGWNGE